MTVIINTKVGENRGRKRVWLEGQRLAREGWEVGQRFTVEIADSSLRLKAKDDGKYTVSRRTRNDRELPVMDLTMSEIAELFGSIEQLRVVIRNGSIVISAHHQQKQLVDRVERFIEKVSNSQPINVASLFHGGGVLDAAIHDGLQSVGIASRLAVAVELEDKYLEASLNNNHIWDEQSLAINSPIQAIEMNRGKPVDIQMVVCGIPCTGASLSGRAKNKLAKAEDHSEAGAMFFYALEFIRLTQPALVLIENVEAYQSTASMAVIRSVLSSCGYQLHETILDGGEWVLERRQRLAVVAVSDGLSLDFDINNIEPTRQREETIAEILEDVPLDSDRYKSFDYLAAKELRDIASKKGFRRQLLTAEADGCGVIGKAYAKCRSTEPFFVHPQKSGLSRLFTPLEHCSLKGVPPHLISGLSDTTAHEILGQSVVYPAFCDLASTLGNAIWSFLATVTQSETIADMDAEKGDLDIPMVARTKIEPVTAVA